MAQAAKRQKTDDGNEVERIKELVLDRRGAKCVACGSLIGFYAVSSDHPYFPPAIICESCTPDDYFRRVPKDEAISEKDENYQGFAYNEDKDGALSSEEE